MDRTEGRRSTVEGRRLSFHLPPSTSRRVFGGIIAHNTYLSGNVGIGTTSPATKLEVSGTITATTFDIAIAAVTADCLTDLCTATATCAEGKKVLYGMTRADAVNPDTCDTNPSTCTAYCAVGATSCAATDTTSGTPNGASVYIVCRN